MEFGDGELMGRRISSFVFFLKWRWCFEWLLSVVDDAHEDDSGVLIHGSQRSEVIWLHLTEGGPSLNDPYSLSPVKCSLPTSSFEVSLPSLVGQLICKPKATQAQTLARVVGSLGRWVVGSLGRWVVPFCRVNTEMGKTRGWDLQQRHQRPRSLQVGIWVILGLHPKSSWSPAFK